MWPSATRRRPSALGALVVSTICFLVPQYLERSTSLPTIHHEPSPFVPISQSLERGTGLSTIHHEPFPLVPIYPLWTQHCRRLGRHTGRFGPFSRALPRRAAEALPSTDEIVAYIAGPTPGEDYFAEVRRRCKESNLSGSKRREQGKPPYVRFDTSTCWRPGEKRIYEEQRLQNKFVASIDNFLTHFGHSNATVIMQVGDEPVIDQYLPILKKARLVDSNSERHVFLMLANVKRHFGRHSLFDEGNFNNTRRVDAMEWPESQLSVCQPFKSRHDRLVWRGVTTGRSWDGERAEEFWAPRRFLLTRWGDGQSKRIDAAPSRGGYVQGVKGPWSEKEKEHMTKLAENKFLLLAEGNDVASGSAWSLFSASVVLMVPPRHETLVLHGMLKPWVHYIPIRSDYSDLDDKMQWCLDNLDTCEDIAHQASIYMYSMWPGSNLSIEVYRRVIDIYMTRYREVIDCYCNED